MGKSPSRKRYEKENPIINFRIDREIKEDLEEMLEDIETTKKDWIEARVDEDIEFYRDVIDQHGLSGYMAAFNFGHDKAEEKYNVEYPCDVCGEPLEVTKEEEKEKIFQILKEASDPEKEVSEWKWGHTECHE